MKSISICVLSILSLLTVGCNGQDKPPVAYKQQQHLCTMMGKIPPPDKLVGESTLLWKQKKVQVYFMDDDGNVRDKVLSIANEWMPYSGVQFIKSYDQQTADIRVSFRTKGWWSYVGNQSHSIGKDSATLSLDSLFRYSPAKFKTVVLHEFGHSLGLLHEHQHPFMEIKWNYPALYQYYHDTYGVDSTWVKENVLEKYSSLSGIYCEADKKSIMMYEIPAGLAAETVVTEPKELSLLDKKNIKNMYTGKPCK